MSFLLGLHSGVRWIVVAISLLAALWFLLTWLGRLTNANADRRMMLVFTIAIDIQVVIGIILMGVRASAGGFYMGMAEHALTMLIALGVAHMVASRFKNAEPKVRARNYLIGIIVVLVLVFIGVTLLAGGLSRWGIAVS
jgi:hypothetical protein